MEIGRLLVFLSCLTGVSWTHPDGVPLDHPNICQTMLPSHKGTPARTDAAPFSIAFNATCYTATVPVNVTILATKTTARFIGFFVEARKPNIDLSSYGTFDNNGDHHIKKLNCFDKEASAVCQYNPAMRVRSVRHAGHDHGHEHEKWTEKTFKWTPPNDNADDLEFVATIVEEKYDQFWVGVKSKRVGSCERSMSSIVGSSTPPATAAGSLSIHLLLLLMAIAVC